MKEYIERESLQDEIRGLSMSITGLRCGKGVLNEYMKQYRESVLRIVDEQPTADVIEAVRCKDCAVPHNRWTGCPKLNGLVTPPDFYCSYGERKKEDEEK